MFETKYVRTSNNEIIVFTELIQHKYFKDWEPISAGFISFSADKNGEVFCKCYGESVSLKLKSMEQDTLLANRQILGRMM